MDHTLEHVILLRWHSHAININFSIAEDIYAPS